MIVNQSDLDKLKHPENFKFKVYCSFCNSHYDGHADIAAENADEANQMIQAFVESDPQNKADSRGLSNVSESNHYDQFADEKGILENTIRYIG